MNTKQVIVIRKDLNMRKGKMIAQGAHASIAVLKKVACTSDGEFFFNLQGALGDWLMGHQTKIVVYVKSEKELHDIYKKAEEAGILCSLIQDAGRTEFKEPTYTAVAIGPDYQDKIDPITKELPLL